MLDINVVYSGESREGAASRSESIKIDLRFLETEVVKCLIEGTVWSDVMSNHNTADFIWELSRVQSYL
jgi:hypothetical protein